MNQGSFADLGTPLFDTTFVILDLETTGGSKDADAITEVGAIKSVGGQTIGTFQTLVRPAEPIPASIELLTGISDSMVATAPPIEEVLPSLWEFLNGCVLVAHNASFDAGFLTSSFTRHGYSVPFRKTVCTLRLARWLMRGETRDLRLETLAGTIGTAARPCHRAFPDAQATLELFHRLLELAGPVGVLTFEDLISFTRVGRKPDIGKASLAAKVPRVPGVYRFLDIRGRVLYVGKAKNLRSRVRSYFYGDERPRLGTLVREIAKVEFERTNSELAAEVRELELIRQHQPRYNRRNRRTGRSPVWIRIAKGKIPRLVVTRKVSDQAPPFLGPFISQKQAKVVLEALRDAYPMPRCTDPRKHLNGCAFGQMGRCIAPCLPARRDPYQDLFDQMIDCINSDPHSILERLNLRMSALAEDMRYEEAADLRDRIELLTRTFDRQRIIQALMLSGDILLDFSEEQSPVRIAIRQGRLVAVHAAPDASGHDVEGIFAFAPPPRARQWVTYEEWEEMQIIWRHLGKYARQGARVLWCSELRFLPS